jgi:hypothetical protein
MKRTLATIALALVVGVAALPASAQIKSYEDLPTGAPPSTQPTAEGERRPGAPHSPQLGRDKDERPFVRPAAAEARRCVSNFKNLDKNSDRVLAATELGRFGMAVKAVDTNNDGKITSAEFKSACVRGILKDEDIKG